MTQQDRDPWYTTVSRVPIQFPPTLGDALSSGKNYDKELNLWVLGTVGLVAILGTAIFGILSGNFAPLAFAAGGDGIAGVTAGVIGLIHKRRHNR